MRPALGASVAAALLSVAHPAFGQGEVRIAYDDALRAARQAAPDLAVARAREQAALTEVGVAGVHPNPSVVGGTSTQAAKISAGMSLPLVVFGQRGAAMDAARADAATAAIDSQVAWTDVRQSTARAFAGLWLAEGIAAARRDSAAIAARLEGAVAARVQVGAAPELEALRVRAERVRAEADALGAMARVTAAGSDLGRWIGARDGGALRTSGAPFAPDSAPPLVGLLARIDASALVRREESDVQAAEAHVARERVLVRPMMTLDLGADVGDPTLPATNYRAQLAVEVPLFSQRGAQIDRERAHGEIARARANVVRVRLVAELTSAYRLFDAATAQQRTLAETVVPAAEAAAKATEEAYALGRSPLVAVLDAERALVDARVILLEAKAARAGAWADVEHALGIP